MEITRRFVAQGADPFSTVELEPYDCVQKNWQTGEEKVILRGAMVPKKWSKNARDILITKYFRRAGVPEFTMPVEEAGIPDWLQRNVADEGVAEQDQKFGGETSIVDVVHRLAGHWTYEGFKAGYFNPSDEQLWEANTYLKPEDKDDQEAYARAVAEAKEVNAKAFYDEIVYMLLHQMAAPNSPQFFNTGLYWAYGIKGKAAGNWYVNLPHSHTRFGGSTEYSDESINDHNDHLRPHLKESTNAYERTQGHACFILEVKDSMMSENGICDWYTRESRIFKYGSGSGANVSNLRAKHEPLSGGGTSSGLMSWLRTADYNAGAIKSGGTTRRAAKMLCLDLDHPDVEEFIECKMDSESAVAFLVAGSKLVNQHCQHIMDMYHGKIAGANVVDGFAACTEAEEAGVPEAYVMKATQLAQNGERVWPGVDYDTHFEGKAYAMVPWQNANNSIRVPTSFYEAVDSDGDWSLIWRKSREIARKVKARELEDKIAKAAWFCADPGVQYDTIINDRNVTPNDGRIDASNPCSEHMRLKGSGCNLGSLSIMKFVGHDGVARFNVDDFLHGTRLFTMVLDITNTMAHLPDRDTALGVYNYRDIGLGYAEVGALLMSYALPYDSHEGVALTGAVTALMQGEALRTSALMAKELGAYPRFQANREHHLREVRNELATIDGSPYEDLAVEPRYLDFPALKEAVKGEYDYIKDAIKRVWKEAYGLGVEFGYRNAEATVLAPTGTIGILMDCDTTGVEPLFGLKVFKTLIGGTEMKYPVASCVTFALERLGYDAHRIEDIVKFIAIEGVIPRGMINVEHWKIFQTALSTDSDMTIRWGAHLKMMAAAQPFISGAISKTINMPSTSTIDDVKKAYRYGHDLALKAVAIYRDQSKLSQPLNLDKKSTKPAPLDIVDDRQTPPPAVDEEEKKTDSLAPIDWVKSTDAAPFVKVSPEQIKGRMSLPAIRTPGIDVCVGLGQGKLYLKTTRYADGKVGEIWAVYSRDQSEFQAMLDMVCKTANVSLQHGVPLDAVIRSWKDSDFAPQGLCHGHPYIKTATSILNLMAKIIGYHELGDVDGIPDQLKEKASKEWESQKPQTLSTAYVMGIDLAVSASFSGVHVQEGGTAQRPETDPMVYGGGLDKCPECRSPRYIPNGAGCKKCMDCGFSGGCG